MPRQPSWALFHPHRGSKHYNNVKTAALKNISAYYNLCHRFFKKMPLVGWWHWLHVCVCVCYVFKVFGFPSLSCTLCSALRPTNLTSFSPSVPAAFICNLPAAGRKSLLHWNRLLSLLWFQVEEASTVEWSKMHQQKEAFMSKTTPARFFVCLQLF